MVAGGGALTPRGDFGAAPSMAEPAVPTIQIERAEIPRMVDECVAALARDPNVYQRMKELVTIAREPERTERYVSDRRVRNDILTRSGTPSIVSLTLPALTERAARAADWIKWDAKAGPRDAKGRPQGDYAPADPEPKVLASVLGRAGDFPEIPPVRGIIESPALAPSGRVIERAGYDEETAFVMLPAFAMDEIPDAPTQTEAAEALRYLWTELYSDFPFADVGEPAADDLDRSAQYARALQAPGAFVGLASIFTVLARPAILGACPGFIFEAPTPGSGKSLQMHITAMVVTGRPAGVMTFPMSKGEPNEEELEKVLSGYALGGARLIAFDNITGNLCGASLDKVLTAEKTIMLRKLGESPLYEMPWAAVPMFSGNNMTMSPDVARRAMVSRIVSSMESPSKRPLESFRHPMILDWIADHLPQLVRAAMVVLRAFWVATVKPNVGTRGSFAAWSAIIPGAIVYAGGPNVIKAWAEDANADGGGDEISTAHSAIMAAWPFDKPTKSAEIIAWAFKDEFAISKGDLPPDGKDDFREALRAICKTPMHVPKPNPLGKALGALREKIRDGRSIQRAFDANHSALWSVVGARPVAVQAPALSAAPVATPTLAAPEVLTCPECLFPRGAGYGHCNPCGVCLGCLDVAAYCEGACHCPERT